METMKRKGITEADGLFDKFIAGIRKLFPTSEKKVSNDHQKSIRLALSDDDYSDLARILVYASYSDLTPHWREVLHSIVVDETAKQVFAEHFEMAVADEVHLREVLLARLREIEMEREDKDIADHLKKKMEKIDAENDKKVSAG